VGDLDDDGTAEVFIDISIHEEGSDPEQSELLTLRDGKVVPWSALAVSSVEDVDGDGRLDLWTRGPYAGLEIPDALGSHGLIPPFFLAHGLPGTAPTLGDPAARRSVERTCSPRHSFVVEACIKHTDYYSFDGLGLAVVCARARGASAEAVERDLGTCCHSYVEKPEKIDQCPSSLLAAAAVEPPVLLR
jgi:hypothetical protein